MDSESVIKVLVNKCNLHMVPSLFTLMDFGLACLIQISMISPLNNWPGICQSVDLNNQFYSQVSCEDDEMAEPVWQVVNSKGKCRYRGSNPLYPNHSVSFVNTFN